MHKLCQSVTFPSKFSPLATHTVLLCLHLAPNPRCPHAHLMACVSAVLCEGESTHAASAQRLTLPPRSKQPQLLLLLIAQTVTVTHLHHKYRANK